VKVHQGHRVWRNMAVRLQLAFLIAISSGLLGTAQSEHWALLVAGSSGYYNYRHQADICHAYQILHKNGIPDERIVVMMYDDIAFNRRNTRPGQIINEPNGTDVYHGVLKDYTGKDVTPENFLNILKGNKTAMAGIGSGKVIESGPDDYVFVNFADHGAPNLIAFPRGELHAKDLIDAIDYMFENKRYKKMVFYIEACESGSMFNRHKLKKHIDVFATTAANGAESSYACYWDEKLRTYLGDVYSVKWMEDSDKENLNIESLQKQYQIVKGETNTSHVQEFGDLSISKLPVGMFQGMKGGQGAANGDARPSQPITDAVPSPDVPLMILKKRLELSKDPMEIEEIKIAIQLEVESRMHIKSTMHKIVETLVPHPKIRKTLIEKPAEPREEVCYKDAVTAFRNHCFDFNKFEHALRHVYVLANLCDKGIKTERILEVISQVCHSDYENIHVREV